MSKFKGLFGFAINTANEAKIRFHLAELEKLLGFTEGLSPEERRSLPKVNDRNFSKVDNALLVVDHAPQILPGFVDGAGYKNSYRLLKQLMWLQVGFGKILERVRDSRMIVGSNLLAEAGMINRVRKDAIRAEVPGLTAVFERLRGNYRPGLNPAENPEGNSESTEQNDLLIDNEEEAMILANLSRQMNDAESANETPIDQAA